MHIRFLQDSRCKNYLKREKVKASKSSNNNFQHPKTLHKRQINGTTSLASTKS